ncbi:MAG: peptidoglycan DD-metalloendopeptidase family protein [Clostridia bacterium]|nr:peptidoglycan DD-metalloendopeptidase family protein [Clostridia bacterium]
MRRIHRSAILAILCTSLVVLVAWAAMFSAGADQLQEEYDEIWQRLEDVDWLMKQNEADRQQAIVDAQNYLDQLQQAETQLNLTQDKIDYVLAEMASIEAEYNRAIEEYDQLYERAAVRLNINFQNRNTSMLDMIFGCDSLMESLRMMFFGVQVSGEDVELLKQLEAAKEDLQQKHDLLYEDKLALTLQQAGEGASMEEIMALYADAQDQLRSIESMYLELQRMEDEMLAESDRLAQLIQEEEAKKQQAAATPTPTPKPQSTATPPPTYTAKYIWPCPDYPGISSYFGMRLHPIYNEWRMHNGIDINAANATYILASAGGTVIAAEWMDGYGYCVMISHGEGIVTLYAHCSELRVSYGDKVTQGQVIALVGSTGLSTGPHCHFEVRLNGTPVNPLEYVQK